MSNASRSQARTPAETARRVNLVLGRIDDLPTLGPVAARLLRVGADDELDLNEIARLIETEPGLTAKLLAMVRSAGRGVTHEITSVSRAIGLLGIDTLRSVVLSVQVFGVMRAGENSLESPGGNPPAFDRISNWRYSVGVACASETLARECPDLGVKPESGFIAGLLHAIGRPALESILPSSYSRVIELARSRNSCSAAVERELIGVDHFTVGKRLAEHWGLPHALQDTAWLSGHPDEAIPDLPHAPLIRLVRTGIAVCRSMSVGLSCDFDAPPDPKKVANESGIDPQAVEACSRTIHAQVSERCDNLGIESPPAEELVYESISTANAQLARLYASISKKSASDEWKRKSLEAVTSFLDTDAGTTEQAASDIAVSACAWFGARWAGLTLRRRAGGEWRSYALNDEGRHVGDVVETQIPAGAPGDGPVPEGDAWTDAMFEGRAGLYAIRLGGDEGGPSAVLMLQEEPDRDALRNAGPLLRAWSASLRGTLKHEGAKRLSEELAEAQRAVAQASRKLADSESMAKLGRVTAGAAHEMNNPLAIISGYTQVLRDRLSSPELQRVARAIEKAAHDVSDLITSLNMLSEPPVPDSKASKLPDVIKDAARRVMNRTKDAGKLKLSLPQDLPLLLIDRDLLAGAMSELILNAAESSNGQAIELRVQIDPSDDRLLIMVCDSGSGMSEDTRRHAFDPFVSSKPAGRGRGLGLTRARSAVEAMGGEIRLDSREGEGTVATIDFARWRVRDTEPSRAAA